VTLFYDFLKKEITKEITSVYRKPDDRAPSETLTSYSITSKGKAYLTQLERAKGG